MINLAKVWIILQLGEEDLLVKKSVSLVFIGLFGNSNRGESLKTTIHHPAILRTHVRNMW